MYSFCFAAIIGNFKTELIWLICLIRFMLMLNFLKIKFKYTQYMLSKVGNDLNNLMALND